MREICSRFRTLILGAACCLAHGQPLGASVRPRVPEVILWVWERPEDLRFLDSGRAGIALYVRSLELQGSHVRVRSRRNPVHYREGCYRIAVVRMEARRPALDTGMGNRIVASLKDLWREKGFDGLQIDFDAKPRERVFYRQLLTQLRHSIPPAWSLSITALGSWCLGDPWIAGLPVDEAVPMLFRMGPDTLAIRRHLDQGGDFSSALARTSVGVSIDEPPLRVPPGRRLYLFSPYAWTERTYREALERFRP